jgi:AcrR family transcriptional regulator
MTEKILSATSALLSEGVSFADISIEQITLRAGISRSAFYDYFPDKPALLLKLVEKALGPVFFGGDEDRRPEMTPAEAMTSQIRFSMRWARENSDLFRAVVETASYDPHVRAGWRTHVVDRFIEAVEGQIRRHQKRGAALPIHPRLAAEIVVAMTIDAVYEQLVRGGGISDEDVVRAVATVGVRALYGDDQLPF